MLGKPRSIAKALINQSAMAMWSCWNMTALPGTTCCPPSPFAHLNLQLQDILERSSYSSIVTPTCVCVCVCVCVRARCTRAQLLQSCLTLPDPMDCSPPASTVHGILQARILEWVAMPSFPTQGSNPGLLHCKRILCPLSPLPLLPSHNSYNNLTMEIQLTALNHI